MPGSRKTKPKIIALCGSPHKFGNTATILKLVLSELSGIQKKVYYTYDLFVHPCTGCGYCRKKFVCKFQDSMDELYEALHYSHLTIVASPVYFSHLPAPLKAIIDRCQVFWEYYKQGNVPSYVQYGYAVLVGAGNYSNMFLPSVITLRHFFNTMNYRFDEEKYLLLSKIEKKKDIQSADISKKIAFTMSYLKDILYNKR